jgi:hypothetical protein
MPKTCMVRSSWCHYVRHASMSSSVVDVPIGVPTNKSLWLAADASTWLSCWAAVNCMVRCTHAGEQVFERWGVKIEADGTWTATYQDKTGDKDVKGKIHQQKGLPSAEAAARLVNERFLADPYRCTASDNAADNWLCP